MVRKHSKVNGRYIVAKAFVLSLYGVSMLYIESTNCMLNTLIKMQCAKYEQN